MSQHFIITYDDATTPAPPDNIVTVGPTRKEFIPLTGPAEVFITPANSRQQQQGYPELEESEWSIGTIRLVVPGGGASDVEVLELLRTTPPIADPSAVQPAPTEHLARAKTLTDPTDPFLHLWWDIVSGAISFKSALKITSTLAAPHFLMLRLIPRAQLRSF